MTEPANRSRRALLRGLALGAALVPLTAIQARRAHAATQPLLSEDDPAAKAEQYVADASRAKGAAPGALCSNCSIYGGADGAAQGSCVLFPGKDVKAGGWCKSWSGL
jgi:high potential iron-sulfur protein